MIKQLHILHEQPEFSVTQISNLIKRNIEDAFSNVRVKGEISGLKIAPSGHAYFSLKDQNSVLASVMWRGNVTSQKIKIEDGMEVICCGNVTTYGGQSKYQLIVDSVSIAGIGALMALLEKRKKQFAQEGLFDPAKKKNIPYLPKKIGVVTSITGAVIRDIIHRLKDRFPSHVVIWPVLVQGDKSSQEVTDAIKGFNLMDDKPDVLIIARGGGSIEDLWSFNEENVIRAAYSSTIPIISAIGHETDITLLDYVADKRAPTPTAAAEMVVPVRGELILAIRDVKRRANLTIGKYLEFKRERVYGLKKSFPDFKNIINNKIQRIDDIAIRLVQSKKIFLERKLSRLNNFFSKLRNPKEVVLHKVSLLKIATNNMESRFAKYLDHRNYQLSMMSSLLKTLSYQNTLNRGFSIIWDQERIISSSKDITNKKLTIEFKDGRVDAEVS